MAKVPRPSAQDYPEVHPEKKMKDVKKTIESIRKTMETLKSMDKATMEKCMAEVAPKFKALMPKLWPDTPQITDKLPVAQEKELGQAMEVKTANMMKAVNFEDFASQLEKSNWKPGLEKGGVHEPVLAGNKKPLAGMSTMGSHVRDTKTTSGKAQAYHKEMAHIHARATLSEQRKIKPKL
jgi:hypothetical protein